MACSQLAPGITLALTYICNSSVAMLSLAFVWSTFHLKIEEFRHDALPAVMALSKHSMPGNASRCGVVVQTSLVTLHCHNRNPSTGRNLWDYFYGFCKKACHTVSEMWLLWFVIVWCMHHILMCIDGLFFKCTQTYELIALEYTALITVAKMCTWYGVNVCMHWAGMYLCTTQQVCHCNEPTSCIITSIVHKHVHLLILCTALRPRCVQVAPT